LQRHTAALPRRCISPVRFVRARLPANTTALRCAPCYNHAFFYTTAFWFAFLRFLWVYFRRGSRAHAPANGFCHALHFLLPSFLLIFCRNAQVVRALRHLQRAFLPRLASFCAAPPARASFLPLHHSTLEQRATRLPRASISYTFTHCVPGTRPYATAAHFAPPPPPRTRVPATKPFSHRLRTFARVSVLSLRAFLRFALYAVAPALTAFSLCCRNTRTFTPCAWCLAPSCLTLRCMAWRDLNKRACQCTTPWRTAAPPCRFRHRNNHSRDNHNAGA